jgi:hypothetical protein
LVNKVIKNFGKLFLDGMAMKEMNIGQVILRVKAEHLVFMMD